MIKNAILTAAIAGILASTPANFNQDGVRTATAVSSLNSGNVSIKKPDITVSMLSIPIGLVGQNSLFKSVQKGTITIGTGETSHSATISTVTAANAVVILDGWTNTDTGSNGANIDFPAVFLADGSTVTAVRNSSSASFTITAHYSVYECNPGVITSNQSVSITMSATSGTTTISSVTTGNSASFYQGCTSTSASTYYHFQCGAALTDATTVTAYSGASTSSTTYATVVQFSSSNLNSSTQQGSVTLSAASSNTATISSVTTGQTMTAHGGSVTTSSFYPVYMTWGTLTNGTTFTATSTNNCATVHRFTAIEFKPSLLKSVNRGSITISASTTSNTATISSVNTSKTFPVWLGFTGGNTSANPARATNSGLDLTDATTITAARDTASGSPCTVGWESIEGK